MKDILYYKNFLYIIEIIYSKIINYYYNNLLACYFKIEKTRELVPKKILLADFLSRY